MTWRMNLREIVNISDSWEPEFMTIIIVTWQLRVTLDSIRNSCDVFVEVTIRFTEYPPFFPFSTCDGLEGLAELAGGRFILLTFKAFRWTPPTSALRTPSIGEFKGWQGWNFCTISFAKTQSLNFDPSNISAFWQTSFLGLNTCTYSIKDFQRVTGRTAC